MNDLQGKVAVVTGASRGIGEASARVLDSIGAQVVLTGRTVDDLERVAGELQNSPVVVPADLAQPGAGTDLAAEILEIVDGVDVLVNNAGIPMRRMPESLTEDEIDLVFAVNVRSLLTLSIGLADSMKSRGGGSIINVSSVASVHGPGARVAYAGTKGAVDAMTRALASDWGPDGIRVNSIAPGLIATAIWEESRNTIPGLIEDMEGRIALKRWGFGDDIADVVAFFASDSSRYVTGETLVVDGGLARVSASATPQVLPELIE
ncbi:MAG: SDR family NAD(P)-dependent oxidoreductase [Actinomycetota bacterium]|mgnify:FL=1|jgi:NAD(P)-dependent dehydrogenase (short-subunit alcohol dehydrogenase family)|nr:SDR family oxidoreductase [Acidimicrobiales bacterium]MEC7874356.1 SDR family NAD(P)-dependent oxidoreductase [Actinomycetota bacterium]MCS5680962.1 SDR family oxidoreductase [Acidimicrobiales bacterium]MEC8828663.1 SDR family NAD(P)-dependent oxidoreductase [Actinomycetota bacterium]MEC8921668.1 SDR family NAD(P)-dependent oxidoreductase [Actinomycetota bacterium]|tara:strand:+ start:2815 stop:3603 length:789 start_codon:yes stop_codon:yes gene_type:complete